MKATAVGLAWYRVEDYDRLRALFDDGVKLPDTHAGWLERAEKVFEQLRRDGARPVKVEIDPDEFVAWCRANGQNLDSSGRRRFAAFKASLVAGH